MICDNVLGNFLFFTHLWMLKNQICLHINVTKIRPEENIYIYRYTVDTGLNNSLFTLLEAKLSPYWLNFS